MVHAPACRVCGSMAAQHRLFLHFERKEGRGNVRQDCYGERRDFTVIERARKQNVVSALQRQLAGRNLVHHSKPIVLVDQTVALKREKRV